MSATQPSRRWEEAEALLPFFTDQWEPLRDVLERAGDSRSAAQMVSRARELEARGLVESRWESAMKVWRKSADQDAALRPVAEAICQRFYELVDHPLENGDAAMMEVARAAIRAWNRRSYRTFTATEGGSGSPRVVLSD